MTGKPKILILGGTAEARHLAGLCCDRMGNQAEVITSLAGRTRSAQALPGTVRIGGFGGRNGLEDFLKQDGIRAVVDATHPFAVNISAHGAAAARAVGLPHIMLERPKWSLPKGLVMETVSRIEDAPMAFGKLASGNVLVTTGVRGLETFGTCANIHFVIRQIEDHEGPLPFPGAEIIVQRPPYAREQEIALMRAHRIDTLLTKESGGTATEAKLLAAHELGVRVVLVERPPLPIGETASSVEEICVWLESKLGF